MLPATFQFIIAMLASALTDRLTKKMAYMREEQRIVMELLQDVTGKKRLTFTPEQRRRLALKGKELTAEERGACCNIVRPETILAWYRQLGARKYDSSGSRNVGQRRKSDEIRKLVLRLANENLGWGYTKIRDALRGLNVEIGRTTVANILAEAGLEPAPVIAGIRVNPDEAWMMQVTRNLLDSTDGFLRSAKFLVHDRDPLFTKTWKLLLNSDGITSVAIPAQSPNCNPHAERFIRSVRNECLDHFIVFGESHLRHLVKQYVAHYNAERFHQGMDGKLLTQNADSANDNGTIGTIKTHSRLAGILNFYQRAAA